MGGGMDWGLMVLVLVGGMFLGVVCGEMWRLAREEARGNRLYDLQRQWRHWHHEAHKQADLHYKGKIPPPLG